MKRSTTQNASLHVYFRELARALNDAGLDMKKVLKPEIDIPWTEENVKLSLWKPIQDAMIDEQSTTKLDTKQVNEVYEVLSRHLSEKLGISLAFPSHEPPLIEER